MLGPQDVLNITVLGENDLSRKYTIEQDGSFTFPLIGRVTARGLTLRDLEQELKKQLVSGGYLKNPEISVAVDAYQSQRIMVWGAGQSAGRVSADRRHDAAVGAGQGRLHHRQRRARSAVIVRAREEGRAERRRRRNRRSSGST